MQQTLPLTNTKLSVKIFRLRAFRHFKLAKLAILVGLTTVVAGGFAAFLLFGSPDLARASENGPIVDMYPGQSAKFNIYYDQASKSSDFNGTSELKILIDERFEFLQGYTKDSYAGASFCVNDGAGGGIRKEVQQNGLTLIELNYTPRSATIPASGDNKCTNGNGTAGSTSSVTLPKAPESFNAADQTTWRGNFEFRVKLKESVLGQEYNLKLNSLISAAEQNSTFGIQSQFKLNDTVFGNTQYAIRITGNTLNPNVNIDQAVCLNSPVVIPSIANCVFPLTGNPNTIYIYPEDFEIQIEGSSLKATSENCSILSRAQLYCQIPTDGATEGNKQIAIQSEGEIAVKGNVDLTFGFKPDGDEDGDGIFNQVECGNATGINCNDSDKDGIPDYLDLDSDNDGIPDSVEKECDAQIGRGNPCNTDKDNIADFKDLDSDNDGVSDKTEKGEYTCDFKVVPVKCENEFPDLNNNNIPDWRDSTIQFGRDEAEFTYFLPKDFYSFGTSTGLRAVYKEQNLVFRVQMEYLLNSCEMRVRNYGSEEQWQNFNTRIAGTTCVGTLLSSEQKSDRMEFLLIINDQENRRWGANSSFQMFPGSLALTKIVARETVIAPVEGETASTSPRI